MRIRRVAVLGVLAIWGGGALAEEGAGLPGASPPALEVESQVPCLLFGGYQVSVGLRSGRLRARLSTIDSGRFDLEPMAFGGHASRFERTFDDGSFQLYADWFLTRSWYVGVLAATHRWRIESETTSAAAHLRTFDAGVGTGYQWTFWRGVFLQPLVHVFLRDPQTVSVGAERYRISGADWNAAFRLGVRL
jgi:hypothetical protein